MTLVLVVGILFLVLFLSLDITLQLVRLYFRFFENEGKYGARQQLVLTDLSKETRKIQEMGARLLAPQRRQNFQQWLNRKATDDEKVLVKAAFTSLIHFLKLHEDHSMPAVLQGLAQVPLVGGVVAWGYQKQHQLWLEAQERRAKKRRQRNSQASPQASSPSLQSKTRSSWAARAASGRLSATALSQSRGVQRPS